MDIVITGSVAFDNLMKFPGLFGEQIIPERLDNISLSFLVDSMCKQRGGVAANIAYTMALLGCNTKIMATVGEDIVEYRTWLEARGVNTELLHVIPGEYTASFFATTDRNSAQIASFYPGAMAKASIQSIKDLPAKPDLVIVSPNDPGAMMKFAAECRETGIEYLYDPSQQVLRLDGEELARDLEGAKFLFCNDYEFDLICKKTGFDRKAILQKVEILVVTQGKSGAMLFTGNEECFIPTVPEDVIIDPTGVGDAFRAGFLVGYSMGFDWILCGQIGALAAVYCLEKNGPQQHCFELDEFVQKFRKHFDDNGKLELLLSKPSTRRVK